MEIIDSSHNSVQKLHAFDGKIILQEQVNVDQNLDRVQRLRQFAVRNDLLGDCVASIPMAAISQWGEQFGIDANQVLNDDKLFDRCLADYSKFKVKGGWT